ncbi:1-acyl-sn-glycerol-3-phosphate acyltransferase [Cesiribacter sp. SM1]|uniref:lysophospholipid acyltransferase family protein n=1 Tax=Cesiribacter sp. SM1 TaxID=2861196 RepID=UPI001CD7CAA0|nr:lysophospholipid acyltransferase family protein [Cesiribacter sp. SM1]
MIKKVLHRIYSTYSLCMFGVGLLLMMPFFMLMIWIKPLQRYLYIAQHFWAAFFLASSFVPWSIRYHYRPRRNRQYVICSNHFSILDIVTMGFLPINAIFVGKRSLTKVPVFGYMFRKLHITVDRNSLKDRYRALQKSMQAVDRGLSLVMFPEGGVQSDNPPQMARFKEGPFRVAIEKQIPILPVTFPYNWLILPDDKSYLLYPQTVRMVVHQPIETKGMRLEDLPDLQQQVYRVIDQELKKYNRNEDRQANPAENCTPGTAGV